MPPVRQLDEAFLGHLLGDDTDIIDIALKSNTDSNSLRSILGKLTSTSTALQQELFEKAHANFELFSSTYNTQQQLHERVSTLLKQFADTEAQVANVEQDTHSVIDQYQHALRNTEKNQNKIEALQTIHSILKMMDIVDSCISHYQYKDAVEHLNKLRDKLDHWEQQADSRVTQLLNQRYSQQKERLVCSLQDSLHAAIHFQGHSMRVLHRFHPSTSSTVHISDVFESIDQVGLLAEELMGIQRLVFKHIIYPYFDKPGSIVKSDLVDESQIGTGGHMQVVLDNEETSDQYIDPLLMLQQIDSVLTFLHQHMFADSSSQKHRLLFGNLLLPELIPTMIKKSLAPAIPSSKDILSDFGNVVQAVKKFESQLHDIYGFQPDATHTLGNYVDNIDAHYAKKRREKVLQEGRKVMIRRLYDVDTIQDDGHYQISQTPQILAVLVSDIIEEAADLLASHPISADSLAEGIQDLLDMYRAIMPSYHRLQYVSSAANSLVFRNDCFWLAKQLTTNIVTKPHVGRFDQLVERLSNASDRLKELGNAWHELAMTQRVQMIQTVMDHLDGFSGITDQKFQHDCDRAVTQMIQLVNSYAAEIRPVVDETLFLDMLARIVESIVHRFIQDIEQPIDIGAEESHILARTLNSMAQLVSAFDLPGRDATESFVEELVPSWQKFWLVKDILEMNMREIMERYRRGDLHMFKKSELVGLLCALFADTELRESNIQEINSGHFLEQTLIPRSTTATPTSASPSSTEAASSRLDYTIDDMEQEDGWGDDDLQYDHEDISDTKPTTEQLKTEYIPSRLDYSMDDLDQEDGWGDNDEDLQYDHQDNMDPDLDTNVSEQPKTETLSSKLDYSIDDMEQEDGWDDDDNLSFEHDDIIGLNTETANPTPTKTKEISSTDEKSPTGKPTATEKPTTIEEPVKTKEPPNTKEPIVAAKSTTPNSVEPVSSKLDYSIDDMEQEDGWGDDDDDLFGGIEKST
ncbi:Centromere/kinetochore Zw10-domain-containing protein [Choanephora cucurbitarum]|nr:Centromere/kinetochore Zw10-domain-containing protein [Choanephora cucurbitarum]